MRTRKHGWKLTSLTVIAMSILLATLAGMLYNHEPAVANQTINLSSQAIHSQKIATTENWRAVIIRRHDTLARIFSKLKIKQNNLFSLTKRYKEITFLRPGKTLYFQTNANHTLLALKYPVSSEKTLVIERRGKNYIENIVFNPATIVLSFKSATIKHSLHSATARAGMTSKMVAQLETIFKDSINFDRGIHPGDRISFLYKEYFINGRKYRSGDIVAAELLHNDKIFHAIRYQYDHNHFGYFTPDGHGLEARFLSAPLHYKRISSQFNLHRFDPVLHEVRPHLGVDYAAVSGTPIQSIGDGHIIFMGREHGFGRMIQIRYDRHNTALYAHMWRYAANLKLHQFVQKGQVIGYVGESGWATGPHLHFGFYVDGKPKNWLALKIPTGQSVPWAYRKNFLATSRQLLAELQLYQDTQLAMNNAKIVKHPRS